MEMDSDPIDQNLLLQFTCLGTTDRDDLVKQFRELIDKVNDATASFYLEMNNWNLQNAICSFLDYHSPRYNLSMVCVNEWNSAEGFLPNTIFCMSWTLQNNGMDSWPRGCTLRCNNANFTCNEIITINVAVEPGCNTIVVANLTSPPITGQYQSSWQLMTPSGIYFGDILSVKFEVHVKLEDGEEQRLSEELAARMALNDTTDCKQMDAEEPCIHGCEIDPNSIIYAIDADRTDLSGFNHRGNIS